MLSRLNQTTKAKHDKFKSDVKYYVWDDLLLWRVFGDKIMCRCVSNHEIQSIHVFCH